MTRDQFARLRDRLSGKGPKVKQGEVSRLEKEVSPGSLQAPQVVLGVDPSLRSTGYGVVRAVKTESHLLQSGTVRCPSVWSGSQCLVRIAATLRDAIHAHQPEVCVVEGLFYAQNLKTALIMGQARGVIMMTAAEAGLDIIEIAPRKVKQAIVGYGAARKYAVARMVQRLMRLDVDLKGDEADALALALTYVYERRRDHVGQSKRL